jgi:hypothetical protein
MPGLILNADAQMLHLPRRVLHIQRGCLGDVVLADFKEGLLVNPRESECEKPLIIGDIPDAALLNQPGHKLEPGDPAVLHVVHSGYQLLDFPRCLPNNGPELFLEQLPSREG